MRKRITLYIADKKVDIDDTSLILFNYTQEDLTDPAIVKNSYSQQVTLKGTPNNNAIFGDAFRLDRRIGDGGGMVGADFSAMRRTPFTIYNEMNEIVESGYVKLDSVTRDGAGIEYKVSLYGGLGSFLYSLAYTAEGEKRTLADIDYLDNATPESELNFAINAENVATAWQALQDDRGNIDDVFKVVNFAPAYNGLPDGNFTADKGILNIDIDDPILPASQTGSDGELYQVPQSGAVVVNMPDKVDEWAAKDLRSYLQRPVLSMAAFVSALQRPVNNGGYTFDASAFLSSFPAVNNNLWLTLPMIPSMSRAKSKIGTTTMSFTGGTKTVAQVAQYTVTPAVTSGASVHATMNVVMNAALNNTATSLSWGREMKANGWIYNETTITFVQAVAYASNGTIVGGSKVRSNYPKENIVSVAKQLRFTPTYNTGDDIFDAQPIGGNWNRVSSGKYRLSQGIELDVEAYNVASVKIFVNSYRVSAKYLDGTDSYQVMTFSGGSAPMPTLFSASNEYATTSVAMTNGGTTVSVTASDTLRSNELITKKMMLTTSNTPADYLLSLCKMYGMSLSYDAATKKVTLLRRNDLYVDDVIDLTKRVDRSKAITINPLMLAAKWYEFSTTAAGGAWMTEYKDIYGREYGIFRVNTGYDFNSDTKKVMESVVFRNAATVLARGRYFNTVTDRDLLPSVFLDTGNTYTLYAQDMATCDFTIPCPTERATIDRLGDSKLGYDVSTARKMEFRDKDNKAVDGSDVLVFFEGFSTYEHFKLTDDTPAMDAQNNGAPCWVLDMRSGNLSVPIFQRYIYNGEFDVNHSLDFGVPAEINIPDIRYSRSATIYDRFWRNYIEDRYDANTKVMTCHVDMRGLQVSQALLRRFYWYDGCLWALNKISNYSLTTYDTVECEFVQVQDKDNYLNGQNI